MSYYDLKDIDVNNKNILLREDFNVPVENNEIKNDARIRAALPTIKYVLSKGGKVALLSHFGRPNEGVFSKAHSLSIVASRLSELIGQKVFFEKTPLNEKSPEYKNKITLYENTRFLIGEKSGDEVLAKNIAKNCDVFVMDAFGASHRKHCSTYTVAKYAPISCGGFLMMNEILNIEEIFKKPKKPVLAIIGGSKISTKLNILNELINKVDSIIIGGGISNTFLQSQDYFIGKSLSEENMINDAKEIMQLAKKKGVQIPLPIDAICDNSLKVSRKDIIKISENDVIKDIGEKTCALYEKFIEEAGTILWNGPVGIFEDALFANGTRHIAKSISKANAITVAGGGDTISAIEKFINIDEIDYVSTGGGAFLEFIEGKELPGIKIIKK